MEGECAISRRCGEDWVHAKALRREEVVRAELAERIPKQVCRLADLCRAAFGSIVGRQYLSQSLLLLRVHVFA